MDIRSIRNNVSRRVETCLVAAISLQIVLTIAFQAERKDIKKTTFREIWKKCEVAGEIGISTYNTAYTNQRDLSLRENEWRIKQIQVKRKPKSYLCHSALH